MLCLRNRPSYVLQDNEREWSAEDRPVHSIWHYQGWILGLLAAMALLGFVLGMFAYIAVFLRVKARVRWHWTLVGGLGAVAVLATLSYFLGFYYPQGLLQHVVDMPWPFD